MIEGDVDADGVPLVTIHVAGDDWQAVIDTGFNGDLELPEALRGQLQEQHIGRLKSSLAGGHAIEEDAYAVWSPFAGKTYDAVATFGSDTQILLGTNLLREHHLVVGFVSRKLQLERE